MLFAFNINVYAIDSGSSVSATLVDNEDTDEYSFSLGAGQSAAIHVGDIDQTAFSPRVHLYDSGDNLVTSHSSSGGARIFHRAETGDTFKIVVSTSYADGGSYSLDFVTSNGSTEYALESGVQLSGSLGAGEMDSYSFSAQVDEVVTVHLGDSAQTDFSPRVTLFTPDGLQIADSNSNGGTRVFHRAVVAGQYTAVVYNQHIATAIDAAAYTIDLAKSVGSAKYVLESGVQQSASLTPGSMDSYSFSAQVDEAITVHLGDSAQTDFGPRITLFTPDGLQITDSNSNGGTRVFHRAAVAGQYTVVVYNQHIATGIDEANYTIDFVGSSGGVKYSFNGDGSSVKNVGPGTMDSYGFNLVSPGEVALKVQDASNNDYSPYLLVYGPSGELVYSRSQNLLVKTTLELDEVGRYTVVVANQHIATGIDEGTYYLSIVGNVRSLAAAVPAGPAGSLRVKAPCTKADCKCNCKGNPINLPQGFKAQFETDYKNGHLEFSRTYRSDSSWTESDLGVNWRHNYLRKINFFVEDGLSYAELVDGTGSIVTFVEDGTLWTPVDSDIRSHFEEIVDLDALTLEYHLTTPNETVEYFNQDGLLIRVEYLGSQSLDYQYDEHNRLASITDEQNRTLQFSYDAQDRITELTTPDGDFAYQYDASGNLIQLTKPDSKTRAYHYEDTNYVNALTGITDERGVRSATWNYDDDGRAISSEHAGGVGKSTITYNDDLTVTSTNALGKQSTYHYETILGVRKVTRIVHHESDSSPASEQSFSYTLNGLLATATDAEGHITAFDYNNRGLETVRIEAQGTVEERVITTSWLSDFRLPDTITEPGRVTDYEYDEFGRTVSVTVTDTATNEARTTTSSYYNNTTSTSGNLILGRLKSIDGPRTDADDIVSYEYDGNFNVTKISNALGHEVNVSNFDASGRPLSTTDANGVVTTMSYDTMGRLLSQTRGDRTSNYEYDAAALLQKITLPDGRISSFDYDDAGRLIKTTSTTGEILELVLDNAGNRLQEIMKDSAGNVTNQSQKEFDDLSRLVATIETINGVGAESVFQYDLNGNLKTVIDAKNQSSTYIYDALLRVVEFTDAKSGATSTSFNPLGQVSSVTAPNSAQTQFSYNAFGDVVQEISPDRGTTAYTYDEAGNLSTRTDARGITASYSYDVLNRLVTIDYPGDDEDVTYTYDVNPDSVIPCDFGQGKLCRVEDESGVTHFSYDQFGNVVQRVHQELGVDYSHSFAYNKANRMTSLETTGNRTIAYSYDSEQRIAAIDVDIDDEVTNVVSNLAYRPDGQEADVEFANGVIEERIYNTSGLLLSISTDGSTTPVDTGTGDTGTGDTGTSDTGTGDTGTGDTGTGGTETGTDPKTNPSTEDGTANVEADLSTDDKSDTKKSSLSFYILLAFMLVMMWRLVSVRKSSMLKATGIRSLLVAILLITPITSFADFALEYDLNKNITSVQTVNGLTTFQYDELNRLVDEQGPKATQAFTYDANGNRLSDGDGGYTYDSNSNVMSSQHGENIQYDAAGNMTDNGKGLMFTYNNAGRLKTVSDADGLLATYTYNAFGQRTRKVLADGTTTIYHYDLSGQFIEETLQDGSPQTTYVWRNNKPTAVIYEPETESNSSTTEDKTVYLHVDHLNTPREATDDVQETVWIWQSDAFGSTDANEDVDGDGETVAVNLRFPGQYYDAESGMYYNWNRYYDSESGRYVRSDPIGVLDGTNTFSYVKVNPNVSFDPSGLLGVSSKLQKDYPLAAAYIESLSVSRSANKPKRKRKKDLLSEYDAYKELLTEDHFDEEFLNCIFSNKNITVEVGSNKNPAGKPINGSYDHATKTLYIAWDILEFYQKSHSGDKANLQAGSELLLNSTVKHEVTHHLIEENNIIPSREPGDLFEELVWGEEIHLINAVRFAKDFW